MAEGPGARPHTNALGMAQRIHVLVHRGPESSREQLVRVPKSRRFSQGTDHARDGCAQEAQD